MTPLFRARATSFSSCESVEVFSLSIVDVLPFLLRREALKDRTWRVDKSNDADSGKSREALALPCCTVPPVGLDINFFSRLRYEENSLRLALFFPA